MPRLTPQQIESIPDLYNIYKSLSKVWCLLNCNHKVISKYLKIKWIAIQWVAKLNESEHIICNLYKDFKSSVEIWKQFNVNYSVIIRILKKNNIQLRHPWENREWINNPRWKKQSSANRRLSNIIRNRKEMKKWKKDVAERDNYKCIECLSTKNIEIDHIKPLAILIKEYNITKNNISSIEYITDLFDIANGRTLCNLCHRKTKTYGGGSAYIGILLNKSS